MQNVKFLLESENLLTIIQNNKVPILIIKDRYIVTTSPYPTFSQRTHLQQSKISSSITILSLRKFRKIAITMLICPKILKIHASKKPAPIPFSSTTAFNPRNGAFLQLFPSSSTLEFFSLSSAIGDTSSGRRKEERRKEEMKKRETKGRGERWWTRCFLNWTWKSERDR